ncbi:8-oxo-dGTP diphosphatase [Candidatus Uhrbacteria bacterium]|nr:8-oxo-dGTP diphosphatase [Candidatus Uhrbacteria bacterium]
MKQKSYKRRVETLMYLFDGDKVLLGLKKRRLGAGRWNGFGGGQEGGETLEQAAIRETKEEIGVDVQSTQYHGVIDFYLEHAGEIHEVHIFSATQFSGEPCESDEMTPQWFLKTAIPYADMWPSDVHWMPYLLKGKTFRGTINFTDYTTIQSVEIREL